MSEVGVCLRLLVASAGSSQTRRVGGAPRGGAQAIHLVAAIMQQEKPRFWTWLDAPGRFHRRAAAAAAPPRSPRPASPTRCTVSPLLPYRHLQRFPPAPAACAAAHMGRAPCRFFALLRSSLWCQRPCEGCLGFPVGNRIYGAGAAARVRRQQVVPPVNLHGLSRGAAQLAVLDVLRRLLIKHQANPSVAAVTAP